MSGGHTLVLGYGNPGRIDDGLGPALADRIGQSRLAGVRTLAAYQLQVEHAADIAEASKVVFADAALGVRPDFELRRIQPKRALRFSTHSASPESLLALARDVFGWRGAGYVLALRGEEFDDFGEGLSPAGERALAGAAALLLSALRAGDLDGALTQSPAAEEGVASRGSTRCGKAST